MCEIYRFVLRRLETAFPIPPNSIGLLGRKIRGFSVVRESAITVSALNRSQSKEIEN